MLSEVKITLKKNFEKYLIWLPLHPPFWAHLSRNATMQIWPLDNNLSIYTKIQRVHWGGVLRSAMNTLWLWYSKWHVFVLLKIFVGAQVEALILRGLINSCERHCLAVSLRCSYSSILRMRSLDLEERTCHFLPHLSYWHTMIFWSMWLKSLRNNMLDYRGRP